MRFTGDAVPLPHSSFETRPPGAPQDEDQYEGRVLRSPPEEGVSKDEWAGGTPTEAGRRALDRQPAPALW